MDGYDEYGDMNNNWVSVCVWERDLIVDINIVYVIFIFILLVFY